MNKSTTLTRLLEMRWICYVYSLHISIEQTIFIVNVIVYKLHVYIFKCDYSGEENLIL